MVTCVIKTKEGKTVMFETHVASIIIKELIVQILPTPCPPPPEKCQLLLKTQISNRFKTQP